MGAFINNIIERILKWVFQNFVNGVSIPIVKIITEKIWDQIRPNVARYLKIASITCQGACRAHKLAHHSVTALRDSAEAVGKAYVTSAQVWVENEPKVFPGYIPDYGFG